MTSESFPVTDYERIAAAYDRHREQWRIPPDEVLRALAAATPSVRAVDVACGTGLYLATQSPLFANVTWTGVDRSASMLGHARAKAIGASLLLAAAERLPFADGAFGYVHSSYAFHHFEDKPAALDQLVRVLAPGGALRIVNVEPWSMSGWWVYEFFPETADLDRRRFWPVDRLEEELTRRGLTVEAEVEPNPRVLALADILDEAASRTISQLAALDDDAYERGLGRLRAAANADPGGSIERSSALLRLTARR